MIRVCVTGPESTGKTELAERLANALGAPWVPEAARAYAERVGRPLTAGDVEPIGREHVAEVEAAIAEGPPLLVLDTDLVSTMVYGQQYYGFASAWLEERARARRADLYLLCDIDVPWQADGIRDRPEDREAMFEDFAEALERFGANVRLISGDRDARLKTALDAIEGLRGADPSLRSG